jgi:hypothetical protein
MPLPIRFLLRGLSLTSVSHVASCSIPRLIKLWGVEQNCSFVLENGIISTGFGKSDQQEFHRLLVAVEVVEGHR